MTDPNYPFSIQDKAAELYQLLVGGGGYVEVDGEVTELSQMDVNLWTGPVAILKKLAEQEADPDLSNVVRIVHTAIEDGMEVLFNVSQGEDVTVSDVRILSALWQALKSGMEVLGAYMLHAREGLEAHFVLLTQMMDPVALLELQRFLESGTENMPSEDEREEAASLYETLIRLADPEGLYTLDEILDLDLPPDDPRAPHVYALQYIETLDSYLKDKGVVEIYSEYIHGITHLSPGEAARILTIESVSHFFPQLATSFIHLSLMGQQFSEVFEAANTRVQERLDDALRQLSAALKDVQSCYPGTE